MFAELVNKLRTRAPMRPTRGRTRRLLGFHVQGLEPRVVPSLDQVFDPEAVVSQNYFATSCAYFNTDQEEAQTFTVGISGTLTEVDLYISKFSGSIGDLIVDIRGCQPDGRPTSGTGQQLASVTVPAATVPGNPAAFFAVDLSAANLSVTQGEKLAVILHVAPSVSGDITYYWGGRPDNYYAGGGFTDRVIGNYDWQAVSDIDDLGFKTWVDAPASQPPVVTLPTGPTGYTEGDPPTVFATGASVTDFDSPNFDTGALTVSFAANGTVDDRIWIRDQGMGNGQIGVIGNNVSFEGTDIGSVSGGIGTTPLMVVLNGNATATATQALIENLTYSNVSDNPSMADRTVQVDLTDGDGGVSPQATTTVTVQATNDAPAVTTNAGLTLNRGTTAPITQAELAATDPDNTPDQLTFFVSTLPTHGTILLGNMPTSTFTQANINAGLVSYQHDGTLTTSDAFSFAVSDGLLTTSTTAFAITLTPHDDPPVVTTNTGLLVNQGENAAIFQSNLQVTDPDNTPEQLTFIVTSAPIHGTLLLNGNPTSTFTPTDISFGNVSYANDGSPATADAFTFTVSDGQLAMGPTVFTITVTPTNQAPTLMTNARLIVAKGASAAIRHAALDTVDSDNTSSQLVYTVSTGPTHGTLQQEGNPVSTFTQADIDAGRVSYVNDGSAATSDAFTFTVSDGFLGTGAATFNIDVDTIPVATLSPIDKSAFAGSPVTLTAAASGTPLPGVQWQVKTPSGSIADIPGATSTTLIFVPTPADAGNQYQAVFTNPVGIATSSAATLTVMPGLVILSSPAAQTATLGQTATFVASATGSTKTFVQWQVSTDGGATFTNIAGATKPTLSVKKVSAAQDGSLYRAVFRNAAGQAPTVPAMLTVNYTVTLTGKQTIAVRPGTAVTLAAQTKAVPTAVQWQVSADFGHTWTDIAGATNDSYVFVADVNDSGHQFRANVTTGSTTKASAAASLTVIDPPSIATSPTSQSVLVVQTATFTASATSPTAKMQWQVSTDGGLTFTNIRGATKGTLTLKKVKASMSGFVYRAVFSDAVGVIESTTATLTIL